MSTGAPSTGLLIIGDEILSGRRSDKHLAKVIELLGARGMALDWARFEGDDPARITAALEEAIAGARLRGDVVFSCGGIGATPDDHTRQCAARALGVPLALHPEARQSLLERMRETAAQQGVDFDEQRALGTENAHRMNMARFPEGAEVIPNPYNRIAGFALRFAAADGAIFADGGGVYFVPGFPVMAWPMIEWVLDTHHATRHRAAVVTERSVIVRRGMEAALTPLMLEIEAGFPGVKVFSLPSVDPASPHGVHIELGVKGTAVLSGQAFDAMLVGLRALHADLGPKMVR